LGVIAAAVAVSVAGFVIASSGGNGNSTKSGPSTTETTTATGGTAPKPAAPVRIVVKGGKPVGGVKDITVKKGDPVRFVVVSDVSDEIHVHGYDFHKNVKKGGSVSFDFPAKIDGVFVIELERRAEQIASLKVQP
jgi:hypothetical protein